MAEHNLQDWVGREARAEDVLHAQPARFMQATLDRTPNLAEGDALPPLWHWLYFLEAKPARDLGRDAHPKKGGFLPPVPLPRRMWAGGRFTFHQPLVLGQAAEKRSHILKVVEKSGRSGQLCFVTVAHEIWQGGALCLREEHDIVYREDPLPGAAPVPPQPAPPKPDTSQEITPTEVMLFRYSALTFNGHRIHYDADYARGVEGYDGLVVHGPLLATLLAELAEAQAGRALRRFSFRGMAPVAGLRPFRIEAMGAASELWVKRHDGALAMQAQAAFDPA